MVPSPLPEEDEDGGNTLETSALTMPSVHVTVEPLDLVKSQKNGEAKQPRRLSFHGSVSQMTTSNSFGGKQLRMNTSGSRQFLNNRQSKLLELPFASPPGQPPNHPDEVRGETLKYISQRSSFDLRDLRQIIWVFCCIGWVTGIAEVLIQSVVCAHNSLHWRWSIGFWSGAVFITHSTVGYLTLWKKLKLLVRTILAKTYLFLCGFLAASCLAEMASAVYTYNHASELINSTLVYDEDSYKVSAMEVSIFNSLLSGFGLLGILISIIAAVVTLQRLNIELKIAQSFSTLVSRRSSVVPPIGN